MELSKEKRMKEIDDRIEGLSARRDMWFKAGCRGGMMAMQADCEIKELKLEKEDLINGTHKLPIYRIEKELERVTYLRRDANIFQKVVYSSKIKKLEKELYVLKEKDRNIVVISNDDDKMFEDKLDNDVDEVPNEVGDEIDLNQNDVNNTNYDLEDVYDIDESIERKEK